MPHVHNFNFKFKIILYGISKATSVKKKIYTLTVYKKVMPLIYAKMLTLTFSKIVQETKLTKKAWTFFFFSSF